MVGVTEIELRVAGVTVRLVVPVTTPNVAVIVALPTLLVVARPFEPLVLEIVAIAVLDELQVTCEVKS